MENKKTSQSSFMSKLNNAVASIPLEKMLETIDMAIEAFDDEQKIREKEKEEAEKKKKENGTQKEGVKSSLKSEEQSNTSEGKGFIEVSVYTLKLVKKIIELLIRWRPVANKALDTSICTKNSITASMMSTEDNESNAEEPQIEIASNDTLEASLEDNIDQGYLDMLEQMVLIAAEDSVLSTEEEQYLLNFCDEIGIDGNAFIAKIKKECQTN